MTPLGSRLWAEFNGELQGGISELQVLAQKVGFVEWQQGRPADVGGHAMRVAQHLANIITLLIWRGILPEDFEFAPQGSVGAKGNGTQTSLPAAKGDNAAAPATRSVTQKPGGAVAG